MYKTTAIPELYRVFSPALSGIEAIVYTLYYLESFLKRLSVSELSND